MKSSERRPLLAVAMLGASTLIALAVAELALRLLSPDRYYVWPPGLAVQFESNPSITPGIEGLTRFTINQDGIRGRSFSEDDDYRILAIGGSTTECILLDDEEAWPRLLEAELERVFPGSSVWVGNVGRSGHSALDHVFQAEKLPPQYPRIDAVVILVGVNDLSRRLRRGVGYRSPRWDDREFRQDLLEHAFAVIPETERSYPLHKRTELWQLARRALTGASAEPGDPDQGEGSGYLLDQRARRRRAGRVPSLPELTTALEDYRRSLDEIVTALEAQSIEPVFVTQPALWRADLPAELEALLWFGRAGVDADSAREMYYAAGAMAGGMRRFNEVLLTVCRDRGVRCIDLASRLPADTTVFYDDVHFNEPGARRVAEVLADEIGAYPFVRERLTPGAARAAPVTEASTWGHPPGGS